jgi:hypothetical protein
MLRPENFVTAGGLQVTCGSGHSKAAAAPCIGFVGPISLRVLATCFPTV